MQPVIAGLTLLFAGFMIARSTLRQSPPVVIQRTATQNSAQAANVVAPIQEEKIYTCGARTKKGTPCSRRVHGPVRCWQHKGLPAMLPQEKLLIQE